MPAGAAGLGSPGTPSRAKPSDLAHGSVCVCVLTAAGAFAAAASGCGAAARGGATSRWTSAACCRCRCTSLLRAMVWMRCRFGLHCETLCTSGWAVPHSGHSRTARSPGPSVSCRQWSRPSMVAALRVWPHSGRKRGWYGPLWAKAARPMGHASAMLTSPPAVVMLALEPHSICLGPHSGADQGTHRWAPNATRTLTWLQHSARYNQDKLLFRTPLNQTRSVLVCVAQTMQACTACQAATPSHHCTSYLAIYTCNGTHAVKASALRHLRVSPALPSLLRAQPVRIFKST